MDNITSRHSIEDFLTKGADERIHLNENGLTKYGIALVENNIVNRGSCTCSPAIEEDKIEIKNLLSKNLSLQEQVELRMQISNDLKQNINPKGEDNFEVFYAPSGTDLLYYPLLFAKLNNPDKKILNIVTCIEELGSGTELASSGKCYADYNQFGDRINRGVPILKDSIETVFLRARSKEGKILNNEDQIVRIIEEHPDQLIIINLVYGSKSGIEDNLKIIDHIQNDNIIWNTDLCQFRHSRHIINMLLRKKASVMITGSKFYQSPPFCAALLMSKSEFYKLEKHTSWDPVADYASIFSNYDFPETLRSKLPFATDFNLALTMRWQIAMKEINKFKAISKEAILEKLNAWRDVVINEINNRNNFELMPHQENTSKSIVSFRLKVGEEFMNHQDLQKVHHSIVTDSYPEKGIEKLFIGQAVKYTDRSFLRLAIGSRNIRKFIQDDEQHFELDRSIFGIIEQKLMDYYDNR